MSAFDDLQSIPLRQPRGRREVADPLRYAAHSHRWSLYVVLGPLGVVMLALLPWKKEASRAVQRLRAKALWGLRIRRETPARENVVGTTGGWRQRMRDDLNDADIDSTLAEFRARRQQGSPPMPVFRNDPPDAQPRRAGRWKTPPWSRRAKRSASRMDLHPCMSAIFPSRIVSTT